MRNACRLLCLAILLWPAASWAAATSPPLAPRPPADKIHHPPLAPETPVEQIVVKFHEGTQVRLRAGALVTLPRAQRDRTRLAALGLADGQVTADLHAVAALLDSSRHAKGLERLFTADEETLATGRAQGERRAGRELADLDLYVRVRVPSGTRQVDLESLVEALNGLASVEIAYAQPPPAAPADIPPTTPSVEASQGYLDPAPGGIDARYAWTVPGGRGAGARIVDIEGAWRTSHEDLPPLFYQGGTQINDLGWRNHGTAVLGEMVAPANGYGVTGIAHQAQAGYESIGQQGTASAVLNAAAAAGPGGLVLIELHAQGPFTPNSACNCSGGQCDYVPMEYFQAEFDAIAQVTANGTLVVEAGGNGATDLDDPVYGGRFNRAVRDSGAILVGASNALDRAPTCFTNFGSRVDVHGWGWDVTTLGYGDLFNGGGDENQFYTSGFSGTSSASPIVTGAAASLQGVSLAAGRGNVSPFQMRQLLRTTGTPQAADSRQIGPLPNLRAAIASLQSNRPPTPLPDSFTVDANTVLQVPFPQLLANDTDPDGDALHVEIYDFDTPHGSNNCCSPGGFVYTPDPGFTGIDQFTYTVGDRPAGGLTATATVTVNVRPTKKASFLAQSVPNPMVAGQSYPVSLTVRNTGTIPWNLIGPQCNAYRLGSANPLGNTTWGLGRVDLAGPMAAGATATLNFTVTAPATAGTYNFQWQMVHECVEWLNAPSPNVAVVVNPNPPPTARFTFTCSGLSCSFNGGGSTDNTGIVSYAWSFGDATSGSGVAPGKVYSATNPYQVTLTVTDTLGLASSVTRKVSVQGEPPLPAESVFTVPPCRLLDTRNTTILTHGQFRTVQVAGLCGIPASAKAVSINVTAISPTGPGHFTLYPGNQTSGPFPHASLNFDPAGSPRVNNAILRLATNGAGTLNLLPVVPPTSGQVHATVDVYGYFSEDAAPAPGAQGPYGFQTVTPCRVADTRSSTPIAVNTTRSFTIQGVCGVPVGAAAAALNPVVIGPTAGGHAPLFQAGTSSPVPTINFNAGAILANGARIRLAPTTPDISLNYFSPTAGASTHALIDVYGYFKSDAPLKYRPITACRAVDTRSADQGGPALTAPSTRNFQIRGNCGVPTTAKAVAVNITTTDQAGPGFLAVYPSGTALHGASFLNYTAGQGVLGNGGIVALSTLADDLAVTTANATNVIVDVYGYFQ
jgi:serine protease